MVVYVFMAALPAAAVAFLITVELPLIIKYWIYKIPTFLLSTIVNVLVLTPLYGLLVGGLAVFVGEFVLWPILAIDSKITREKIKFLKASGHWPPKNLKPREITRIVKKAKKEEKRRSKLEKRKNVHSMSV